MERLCFREDGDSDGNTSLHFAAASGNYQLLINSLHFGCDVNAPNDLGWTPLMQAARNCQTTCAKILLDFGADVLIKNSFAAGGSLETVSLILKTCIQRGIPVTEIEKSISPVFFAVYRDKIDILRYLNKYSYSLNQTISLGGKYTAEDIRRVPSVSFKFIFDKITSFTLGLSPVILANILHRKEIINFFYRRGIMAVNVQSPSFHSLSPNFQNFKSTPSSCKTYSLASHPYPKNVPSFVFNSPMNITPLSTPKNNHVLSPTPGLKKRRSSNYVRSPRYNTPCLSPITPLDLQYQSASENFNKSSMSLNSSNHLMNTRMQPVSLTFSSTSSNDSSGNLLHPTVAKNKNSKRRSASCYVIPTAPKPSEELIDDVFSSNEKYENNHEFFEILRKNSLDSCISLFEQHEIDMDLFLTLSKSDLKEIGIDWKKRDDVLNVIYQCNKKRFGIRKRKL